MESHELLAGNHGCGRGVGHRDRTACQPDMWSMAGLQNADVQLELELELKPVEGVAIGEN